MNIHRFIECTKFYDVLMTKKVMFCISGFINKYKRKKRGIMMTNDSLYKFSNLSKLPLLHEKLPSVAKKFMDFDLEVFKEGQISAKTKELIAIAVAHTTGCPYCIEAHVSKYKKMGGNEEEMLEAIAVAAALKAGAAISHSVNAFTAFER